MVILLLATQAILLFAALLFAFWSRRKIGLAPVFMAFGMLEGMKYFATLGVYVEVFGHTLSLSSGLYFTASLVVVVALYIREGLIAIRPVAWNLAAIAVLVALLSELIWLTQHPDMSMGSNPASSFVAQLVGTALLFLDVILVVFLISWFRRAGAKLSLAVVASLTLVLSFDTVAYDVLVRTDTSVQRMMVDSLIKMGFAAIYLLMMWIYFKVFEPDASFQTEGSFAGLDILSVLVYKTGLSEHQKDYFLDELTGAYNRKFLRFWLKEQIELDHKRHIRTGLLLIDIDHFKQINDTYGHAIGDAALKHLVTRLSTVVRRGDVIVRWGGEEFIIVLPSVRHDEIEIVANKIRETVSDSPLALENQQVLDMTVTIGVALSHTEDGVSPQELLETADKRLYRGKRAGRNQVVYQAIAA